jgi:hypothetical protein
VNVLAYDVYEASVSAKVISEKDGLLKMDT